MRRSYTFELGIRSEKGLWFESYHHSPSKKKIYKLGKLRRRMRLPTREPCWISSKYKCDHSFKWDDHTLQQQLLLICHFQSKTYLFSTWFLLCGGESRIKDCIYIYEDNEFFLYVKEIKSFIYEVERTCAYLGCCIK